MSVRKSVGIWIRVSTEDQAKGESPEHHEMRARMYADLKEWDVIEVYHLEGVSGKSVMDHPEARRMIEDVRQGHITGLIFSKLARLARNTKQLLEFSDFFQEHKADLISLQENIDTSSPAGRLFYTLIAAMAQWEREEISERVAASVPIRAKLGKSTGGRAPFGYRWVNNQLELDPEEAPIRRHLFELFLEHKRKKTVARMLNDKGYRTRKGAMFSSTSITRLLRDPIAKGLRRANYTKSQGKDKSWVPKPMEEWVFVAAPAIVSEEVWEEVNQILDQQQASNKAPRRKPKNLFASIVGCYCGGKMYVPSNMNKYVCYSCRNKIGKDDLEEIFREQLQSLIISDEEIARQLGKFDALIKEKEDLLALQAKEAQTVQQKVDNLFALYHAGEIPKDGFNRYYQPLAEQLKQIEADLPALQAQIDHLRNLYNSNDQVVAEAKDVYGRWEKLSFAEKRSVVETITEAIIIGEDEIEINLKYIPDPKTSPLLSKSMVKGVHNPRDLHWPPKRH